MSRVKLLLLSVVAVFVVGVFASASASAATTDLCPETVGTLLPALCIENAAKELVAETGDFPFTSIIEPGIESLLEVPETGIHIECTVANDTGFFEQKVLETTVLAMNVAITFSTCTLLEIEGIAKKCKVEEPIKAEKLDGIVANVDTELLDVTFTPESGTKFTEITFGNNGTETCPALIKGTHPVTGKQLCWLLEAELDALAHLLECTEEGSSLFLSEDPATFKLTEEVILGGGVNSDLPWSIQLA